eukprot:30497-Pelagococcus_subviridis.AAC.54
MFFRLTHVDGTSAPAPLGPPPFGPPMASPPVASPPAGSVGSGASDTNVVRRSGTNDAGNAAAASADNAFSLARDCRRAPSRASAMIVSSMSRERIVVRVLAFGRAACSAFAHAFNTI